MPTGRLRPVLRFIRQLAEAQPAPEDSDGNLLRRFVARHDEGAFAALVQRHGPMVLAVCRRVLGDAHDAEDAFQATFLVLARKAASLRRPDLLANWLYGVAYRTAAQARRNVMRRRVRQRPLGDVPAPEPVPDVDRRELRQVLDQEINRLPDRYRVPFVLCCLEGRTNEEAARTIGCPTGTVLSRLSRARDRLRQRLARRGVTLSAGALAAALAENVLSAAVPSALAASTVPASVQFAAGGVLAAGEVSSLAQGVLHAMFLSKMRVAVLMVFILCVSIAGSGALVYLLRADEPATPHEDPRQPAAAPDDQLNTLLRERFDAAKEAYEALRDTFDKTGAAGPDVVARASRRLLEAQHALATDRATRLAALEDHLRRLKEIERLANIRFPAGRISRTDYALARYYRLDAEIRLQEAKRK